MKRFLAVVLICIALVTNGAERCSMYVWAICISYLEKYLFKFFVPFFNWVVCLFLVKLYAFRF